jgi:hypothetical protein
MEFYSFLNVLPLSKVKSVTFNNICSVVLIPHRSEYINIKKNLWYSQEDYDTFIKEHRYYIK